MQIFFYALLISILCFSCTPAKIAVDNAGWTQNEELAVKGRNGFLIKQKLSFGEFYTTKVQRSWTKGSSWGFGVGANHWIERINVEFVNRKQSIRFSLTDNIGNESQVTAFSKIKFTDLTVGTNPNSVVNIIGDILKIGDDGTNHYAVSIAISKDQQPWEMLIDNNASQRSAKTYRGILAKNESEYYTITPIYKLLNKSGNAVALPIGGSVGFEFRKPNGETLAAVSLIDNGVVYFSNLSQSEKFLLANAAAALLLQEEISG